MMKKFIPYEKLSKKEKRVIDSAKRKTWNGIDPVTKMTANPKAYNRKKARRMNEDPFSGFCFFDMLNNKNSAIRYACL